MLELSCNVCHLCYLFSVDEDIESQAGEHSIFELGVIVHDDCDYSDIREESSGSAHHVFPVQPQLSWSIETSVVHAVVVTFGQELDASVFFLVQLQHSAKHYSKLIIKLGQTAELLEVATNQ